VSTATAYEKAFAVDKARGAPYQYLLLFLPQKPIRELPLAAANDLEETVIAAHPEIAEVKRRLKSCGARHVLMSGSGGTVFGVFDNAETNEASASRTARRRLLGRAGGRGQPPGISGKRFSINQTPIA